MLILTRSTGETVRIGDDIKVTVLAVNGRSVKLGIQAPDDIAIHRNEIYLKNLAQQGSGAVDRQE